MVHPPDIKVKLSFGEVEDTPLMLDKSVTTQIIDLLNRDLASMFALYHQYRKHSWLIAGPQFRELSQLFNMHATELDGHAHAFGDRINDLGGVPVGGMSKMAKMSFLEEEPEGVISVRHMLERDRYGEALLAQHLREQAKISSDAGDFASETLIKQALRAAEKRAMFLYQHLRATTLDVPEEQRGSQRVP